MWFLADAEAMFDSWKVLYGACLLGIAICIFIQFAEWVVCVVVGFRKTKTRTEPQAKPEPYIACKYCKFALHEIPGMGDGECRRFPPVEGEFPKVRAFQFCGEFEVR